MAEQLVVKDKDVSMIREFILELIKQAPSIAILLYLLIRQDNFIQYLVQQCIVAVNH